MRSVLLARAMMISGAAIGLTLVGYGGWRMAATRHPVAAPPPLRTASTTAVIARRPIPRGETVAASDLALIRIEGAAPQGVLTTPAAAAGRIAATDLAANQLVLAASVTADPSQAGLAAMVPPGHRAISLDVTDEIAVANYLRPGDLVDIQIVLPAGALTRSANGPDPSESRTLLQNIPILAVGSAPAERAPGAPAGSGLSRMGRTLTVAMTPEQVSDFVLARALGRYFLALRNPVDQVVAPGGLTRVSDLRGGAAAPAVRSTVRRAPASSPPIELVVAGRHELLHPGAAR